MILNSYSTVTQHIIIIFSTGHILHHAKESLLVKGSRPHQDVGRVTGVDGADEWDLADEGVMSRHQDKRKVAVLSPIAETLDQRSVCV